MTARHMRPLIFRALFGLIWLAALTGSAAATMYVGLVLDPASTAGGGATSTRSGPGTWHLFELDDAAGHYGIGTYNITMSGATAISNRAPLTTILDTNGDPQSAGFANLRTGTNANPIQAGQVLPGQSPFFIRGFGSDSSSFADQAALIQPGSVVVGPSISPAWGDYDTIAPHNGKRWLFLAEGTYASNALPTVTAAAFNVHTSPTNFTNIVVSQFTLLVIPEPTTLSLVGLGMFASLGTIRRRHALRAA